MKTAIFYYSQSGQALTAAKNIAAPLDDGGNNDMEKKGKVIYKQIVPLQEYPFPWSKDEFFNAFPESRLGIPPSGIEPIDFTDIDDADLVIVVGQSWFLSPSLPIQSFFCDENVRKYLHGRRMIFVNACRNMWLKTSHAIKNYLKEIGADLIGHIVLQDNTPNLISVITIIRWLLYGKKSATRTLPEAGISEKDLKEASRFGVIIKETWEANELGDLQNRLLSAGAIKYKPSVLFIEKVGHRLFGFWAKFVRRKGGFGNPQRRFRLNLFCIYLFTALYVISPFGLLVFYLTYPFRHISRHKKEDCNVTQ